MLRILYLIIGCIVTNGHLKLPSNSDLFHVMAEAVQAWSRAVRALLHGFHSSTVVFSLERSKSSIAASLPAVHKEGCGCFLVPETAQGTGFTGGMLCFLPC